MFTPMGMTGPVLLSVSLLGLLSGCQPVWIRDTVDDPEAGKLVRFRGPVRLALTSALVAPGKESGLPWDGTGSLPPEVAEGLKTRPSQRLLGALFRGVIGGAPMSAVSTLLPWAGNAVMRGAAPPDVRAVVSLNGRTLAIAPTVRQTHVPTWSQVYTDPVDIGDYDQIEINATDMDIAFHDAIGVCTSRGMPYVDQAGYASSRTFTCTGQLWAVALRVSPATNAP